MSNQRPTNERIRIGSIFRYDCSGECDICYAYYQVVGLRGKTLVELRKLQTEEYVDSRCVKMEEEQRRFLEENPGEEFTHTWWDYLAWRRPLPGKFDGEVFTVRAREPDQYDGMNCLRGKTCGLWDFYHEVGEDDESIVAGYAGAYVRIALKKEGKLPSWAETPQH